MGRTEEFIANARKNCSPSEGLLSGTGQDGKGRRRKGEWGQLSCNLLGFLSPKRVSGAA